MEGLIVAEGPYPEGSSTPGVASTMQPVIDRTGVEVVGQIAQRGG